VRRERVGSEGRLHTPASSSNTMASELPTAALEAGMTVAVPLVHLASLSIPVHASDPASEREAQRVLGGRNWRPHCPASVFRYNSRMGESVLAGT
jgi:hypothetical protein